VGSVVYFVGAGLTKSLALPHRPIPTMFDFVSTAANYLYDDVILTTLAELESSDPYPYARECPAAKALARVLVEPNPDRSPATRSRFAEALRRRPSESIEDILDRTGGHNANSSSHDADLRFKYAVRRLFALIGWDVEWAPLAHFLQRQLALPGAHTFVSFNYDLVLDRAIQASVRPAVDLASLYGFQIDFYIVEDPPDDRGGPWYRPAQALPWGFQGHAGERIRILKPHGSLNWLVRRARPGEASVAPAHQRERVVLPLTESGEIRYCASTSRRQEVELPDRSAMGVEPAILTPTSAKAADRQFFVRVRELEEKAIREAEEVFVLGWSIPRTDRDQECLIRGSVAERPRPFSSVTAVNYGAGVEYFERVRDVFGAGTASLHVFNAGFRDYVKRL
jgi:hypothetical protein